MRGERPPGSSARRERPSWPYQSEGAPSRPEGEKLAKRYGDRAVELLLKAKGAGYFQETEELDQFRKDQDFEPLQSRSDFRGLLKGALGDTRLLRPKPIAFAVLFIPTIATRTRMPHPVKE
jgi:hypothetical protein